MLLVTPSRPFKSIDDQLDILEKRGMVIENREHSYKVLLRNNYYRVINGYKSPFLKRNADNSLKKPEEYKDKTRFSELFSLYKLDRELRNALLEFILIFESNLNSILVHKFSELNPDSYSYLNLLNYSDDADDLSNVLKNMSNLSNKIERNRNTPNVNAVKHYLKNHDCVPLWVLVNYMTIGETQYLFSSLKQNLKSDIAKEFSIAYKEAVNSKEKIDIEELKMILKAVTFFRNVCAHEEVLFNYKLVKGIKLSLFDKYFVKNPKLKGSNSPTDLFAVVSIMKLVLSYQEYKTLKKRISRIFFKYKKSFKSINFEDILDLMGFPVEWEKALE